jgi:pyrroline-5-carboxylate reductase
MRVLVIGAGKMVASILTGLSSESVSSWGIVSKTGHSAKKLAGQFSMEFCESVSDYKNPDWILLGCKPQQLKEIKIPDVPVMSLLAAIPESTQKNILGVSHLIRVMPNLPVKTRTGVILLSSSSKPLLKMPEELFSKLGLVKTMAEKELEELTLLTGSGPALFYEFTRSLAGSFNSLSEPEREELAQAVLKGSAASLGEADLQTLIDAVTSKGGVTIAVLEEWRKNNLGALLKTGVENGKKRTEELKAHLLQS